MKRWTPNATGETTQGMFLHSGFSLVVFGLWRGSEDVVTCLPSLRQVPRRGSDICSEISKNLSPVRFPSTCRHCQRDVSRQKTFNFIDASQFGQRPSVLVGAKWSVLLSPETPKDDAANSPPSPPPPHQSQKELPSTVLVSSPEMTDDPSFFKKDVCPEMIASNCVNACEQTCELEQNKKENDDKKQKSVSAAGS
jgi:hypothetical protein